MTTPDATSTSPARLCAWCGSPIQQPAIGRSRAYCRRSCRQRAYEARRQREAVVSAVASAVARTDSSRDESRAAPDSSRDESRSGPVPADSGVGWVRSMDVVDAQLRELEARRRG